MKFKLKTLIYSITLTTTNTSPISKRSLSNPFGDPNVQDVRDFIAKIDPLLIQFEQNRLRNNPFQDLDNQNEKQEQLHDDKIRFSQSLNGKQNSFRDTVQEYLSQNKDEVTEFIHHNNNPSITKPSQNTISGPRNSGSSQNNNKIQILNKVGHDISSKLKSIPIAKLDSIVSTNWTPDEKSAFQNLFKMSTTVSERFRYLEMIREIVPEFEHFSRLELGGILDFINNQAEHHDEMRETVWNDQSNLMRSYNHVQRELPCETYQDTWYLKSKNKCVPQLNCQSIYQNVIVNPKVIANGLGKQIRTAKFKTSTNLTRDSPSGYPGKTHQEIKNLNLDYKISEKLNGFDPFTPEDEEFIKIAYIQTKQDDKNGRVVRDEVSDRVNAGLKNLLEFQGNDNVLEIYGYCNEEIEQTKNKKGELETVERTIFISEMCENGDLASFIGSKTFKEFDMIERVKLIISFLKTFEFLHNSPTGTRINCDMNGLHRALTQFLVTDSFNVVLNDLDDIPLADKSNRCEWGLSNVIERHPENFRNDTVEDFKDNFLAPEQMMSDEQFYNLYPEELEKKLEDGQIPTRFDTEKIDIWKIPDMVLSVLTKTIPTFQQSLDATKVFFATSDILKKCKEIDYRLRPTAAEIVEKFEEALQNLEINRIREYNGSLDDSIRLMKNIDGPFYDDLDRTKLVDQIMSYGKKHL